MTGDMLAIDELIVLAALLECGPLHSNDLVSYTAGGGDALLARGLVVRVIVGGVDGWLAATPAGGEEFKALYPGPHGCAARTIQEALANYKGNVQSSARLWICTN